MDNISVLLEHVDLLNGLDRLDIQLLKRALKLLVVRTGRPGNLLHLTAGSTLAAIEKRSLVHRSIEDGITRGNRYIGGCAGEEAKRTL